MNIKTTSNDESGEDVSFQNHAFDQINDESLSETVDEIENGLVPEKVVNRLTNLVRKQYHAYLEKLLKDNFETWCSHQQIELKEAVSLEWIKKCASLYEEKALKSCMIVQFYRKSMLKIIANIRRETVHGKLVEKLGDVKEQKTKIKKEVNPNLVDVSTQTDIEIKRENVDLNDYKAKQETESLSLQEKMECFQKRLEEQERILKKTQKENCRKGKTLSTVTHKRKSSKSYEEGRKCLKIMRKTESSPIISPEILSPTEKLLTDNKIEVNNDEEDEVARGLEMLFGGETNELDDIFGEGTCDPQIDQILKEIEQAKLPGSKESTDSINNKNLDDVIHEDIRCNVPLTDEHILSESLWPCELHMQQQKLREILMGLSEYGIRMHERIKSIFLELFGEDSDDEFAVYSPTLELNEVLLASCKKRIAPWVVKYLMIPMKEGLIGNRFLFKKFAKKLATSLVMQNQYPDENYIKNAIEEFFCYRRTIMSIDDIELA